MEKTILAGIDIGGTKIGASFGNGDGKILASDRFATDLSASPESQIELAIEKLSALKAAHGIEEPAAIGLACPGPMSSREGRFLDPPNMPRWHGFALRDVVEKRTGWRAVMMNDANACALAEWLWGAAQGTRTAIFVTMSTGMGAGLIIDGHLFEGPDDLAGEIGHLRLDPDGPVGFGKRGSVEGYLSGPGLVQLARAEAIACLQRGERTALLDGRGLESITSEGLLEAARSGDVAARRAVDRSAHALGRLLALFADLLNPEVVVLGTIGSAYPDLFIPRAREVLEHEAIDRAAARLRIATSELGSQRGDLAAIAAATRAGAEGAV